MNVMQVKQGQQCTIKKIEASKEDKRRLLSRGIYEGAILKLEKKGRKQQPSLLFVCGNFLMLREKDLKNIEVEVI